MLVQFISGRKLYRIADALTNISCGIIQQLSGIVFKVFSFGAYVFFYEYLRVYSIESTWYSWIILFIGVDFFYYWAHRKSHEINLFWGGHVVHHQSEDYNFSVALRQSSFQTIWTFAFYLPLAVAGFNPVDFLFINALTTLYQFWIHTETIGKLGPLEIVFNTPSHHRVHHGKDPKYIDRNHAGVFIIWDKMFGTFQKEEEKPVYGITNPVNSWNPFWANFEHYGRMYRELQVIPGFTNKLKYLFKKPGWLPDEMGGYRSPKNVDKGSYRKYSTTPSNTIIWYSIFQYLIILAFTSLFLFNLDGLSVAIGWYGGIWIILSTVSIGLLLELRKWSIYLEVLRNLILVASAVTGFLNELLPITISASMLAVGITSILFTLFLNYAKIRTAH